jgi:hypothetical protein
VLRQRIVGAPFALFVELHHGHAGDRLGHRVNAKDGVAFQRMVPPDVFLAVGRDVGDLAVTRQQRDDAGQPSLVDHLLHAGVEAPETFRRDANRFRRRNRQIADSLGSMDAATRTCNNRRAEQQHHRKDRKSGRQSRSHRVAPLFLCSDVCY